MKVCGNAISYSFDVFELFGAYCVIGLVLIAAKQDLLYKEALITQAKYAEGNPTQSSASVHATATASQALPATTGNTTTIRVG